MVNPTPLIAATLGNIERSNTRLPIHIMWPYVILHTTVKFSNIPVSTRCYNLVGGRVFAVLAFFLVCLRSLLACFLLINLTCGKGPLRIYSFQFTSVVILAYNLHSRFKMRLRLSRGHIYAKKEKKESVGCRYAEILLFVLFNALGFTAREKC